MHAVRGRRERSPRPQEPKDDGVAKVRTSVRDMYGSGPMLMRGDIFAASRGGGAGC